MKEEKLYLELADIKRYCRKYENIYIYGAGRAAIQTIELLKENTEIIVKGIIVSSRSDGSDELLDLPIAECREMCFGSTDGVIVATTEDHWKDITSSLRQNGFQGEPYYQHFRNSRKSRNGLVDTSYYLESTERKSTFFEENRELQFLGEKYGTDKASIGFLSKYELFLSRYKERDITVVELGIKDGASIRMWRDYFAHASIYGVDIEEKCQNAIGDRGDIGIWILDLGKEEALRKVGGLSPTVVIDDASHIWSHQIKALVNIFPKMRGGGVYILEDIHTSFRMTRGWGFDDIGISAYEFCHAIQTVVTSGEKLDMDKIKYGIGVLSEEIEMIASQVDMMSFVRNSCIIVKK